VAELHIRLGSVCYLAVDSLQSVIVYISDMSECVLIPAKLLITDNSNDSIRG